MLKFIRKKGLIKSVIWVIVVLIVISFGFMGTAYLARDYNHRKYAGEIFGEKIPNETFQKHFEAVNVNSLIQYGDKYYDVRQYLNLPSQTWDRMILLHEANKQNIQVSNDEVIDAIQKFGFFQKDGQFDTDIYGKIVANVFKTTPRQFEEITRDSLRITKMLKDLSKDIQAKDEDLFNVFKQRQEKVQVSYISLSSENFKDQISVSEADIKSFYTEKKLDFIQPESVNIEYVQLKFPDQATDEDKTKVRQTADQLLSDLTAGNESVLAAQNLTLKATGFFSRENPKTELAWPLDALDAMFDLTSGEWYGPFENGTGLFLSRLKERKDAYMPELTEVTDKVKDALVKSRGLDLAKARMNEYHSTITEKLTATTTPDFKAIAQSLGLTAVQTPAFTRGQYLPKIGVLQDFQEAAFGLSETNRLSTVISNALGSFVLFFDAYTPASQEEFAKAKDAIEKDYLNAKRNEMYSTLLSKLRAQSNFKDYSQH